jgi:hypothetical protein
MSKAYITPKTIEFYGKQYDVQNIIKLAKKKFQKTRKHVSVSALICEITGHPVKAVGFKVEELADILKENHVLVRKKRTLKSSTISSSESNKPVIQSYMQFKTTSEVNNQTIKESGFADMGKKAQVEFETSLVKPNEQNEQDRSNQLQLKLDQAQAKISRLEEDIEQLIENQPPVWCLRNLKDGSLVLDQWDTPRFGPLLFSNEDTAHEWLTRHLRITAERVEIVPYNSLTAKNYNSKKKNSSV